MYLHHDCKTCMLFNICAPSTLQKGGALFICTRLFISPTPCELIRFCAYAGHRGGKSFPNLSPQCECFSLLVIHSYIILEGGRGGGAYICSPSSFHSHLTLYDITKTQTQKI